MELQVCNAAVAAGIGMFSTLMVMDHTLVGTIDRNSGHGAWNMM